jgi:hypothetical protein
MEMQTAITMMPTFLHTPTEAMISMIETKLKIKRIAKPPQTMDLNIFILLSFFSLKGKVSSINFK